jgi:hypothetical protein
MHINIHIYVCIEKDLYKAYIYINICDMSITYVHVIHIQIHTRVFQQRGTWKIKQGASREEN